MGKLNFQGLKAKEHHDKMERAFLGEGNDLKKDLPIFRYQLKKLAEDRLKELLENEGNEKKNKNE